MDSDTTKAILRRLDSIEKTQKLQFDDRNILEDILLKHDKVMHEVANLREEVKLLKENVKKADKNIVADVKDVMSEVTQVKDDVQEVTKSLNPEN